MSATESMLAMPRERATIRQQEQRYLKRLLLVSDMLMIALSCGLAYALRFIIPLEVFHKESSSELYYYAPLTMALFGGLIVLFHIYGLYDRVNLLGGTTEYARLFNAITAGIVLMTVVIFLLDKVEPARGWLLLVWLLTIVLGISTRFMVRRVIYSQRRNGRFLDRTLIIGANPEGLAVAQQLCEAPSSGARILGFVDDYLPIGSEPIAGVPVIGRSSAFSSLVYTQNVDVVVIANNAITRERLLNIYGALDALQEVEVRLASGLFELLTTGVRVREEGYVPLVVLNKTRITGVHYALKTMLDYSLAATALLLLSPIFLIMAIMIKRDSPGPIFYRRRVVGQSKQAFDAFKFRTMYVNGDSLLTPEQRAELDREGKLKDDPRVTRMGAFLRRYSLDELPQLVNVLLGQMSLIGPRIITAPELEKFGKWQYNLATVKPGMTGLWQVSGRSDLSYEDRVRLDMHYIRNHSIWLDLHILIRTIPALLSGRGAY